MFKISKHLKYVNSFLQLSFPRQYDSGWKLRRRLGYYYSRSVRTNLDWASDIARFPKEKYFFLSSGRIIRKSLQSSLFPKRASWARERLTLFIWMIPLVGRMERLVAFLHKDHALLPRHFSVKSPDSCYSGRSILPQEPSMLLLLAAAPDHTSYSNQSFF